MNKKAGYVSVIGRPNAGKSALVNYFLNETINMVSHKQNATRKRSLAITHYDNTQMIFVDTPGIHQKEKLLNQFMLKEALTALGDCDLALFLAPVNDDISHYEKFLSLSKKPHIVLLTKIDLYKNDFILQKIAQYQKYQDTFLALIPTSIKHEKNKEQIFKVICKYLPEHSFFFDEDLLTTQSEKEICANFVLEAIFEKVSDEIPYESDVQIDTFKEQKDITHIHAMIIVEKNSQKIVFIGKNGETIKRIGKYARDKIEAFLGKKIFLKLFVSVKKGWSKNKKSLGERGYFID